MIANKQETTLSSPAFHNNIGTLQVECYTMPYLFKITASLDV